MGKNNSQSADDSDYRGCSHCQTFGPHSGRVDVADKVLCLLKWKVRGKALRLGACRNGSHGDFRSQPMATFEVEHRENGQFCAGALVSIGLKKTMWIELLKAKDCFWCFRKDGFPLFRLPFQCEEIRGIIQGARPAIILPEQVEILAHKVSGVKICFPSDCLGPPRLLKEIILP
jgi:hypothetical protein